jgi:putative beta-lysine N-acetyltransferase
MGDKIVKIGNCVVQHGKSSDRVYLMKLSASDFPSIIDELDELATKHGYSKIFAKVPQSDAAAFANSGYRTEAYVPKLYNGREDGRFMGKYFTQKRQAFSESAVCEVLQTAYAKAGVDERIGLPTGLICRKTQIDDAQAMSEVYREVFATYPFPIYDPNYLVETMADQVVYFGVWRGERLIALSSAERDFSGGNVEMTDFATLPEFRGLGLAGFLLDHMDKAMAAAGFKTAYTIARAVSFGMNITFARRGYSFAGTLINNTNIAGGLECMNVWYKHLLQEKD